MTTTTLTGTHVDALTTMKTRDALASLLSSYEAKHRHVTDEAKREVLRLSRDDMCSDFNVEMIETSDDEGGGSINLKFPPDWHTDQAERFASDFLGIDLSERGYTAGAYFQRAGIGRHVDTGELFVSVRWGLDI